MTVLLYNDPHPVHKRMAESIDASLVAAEQGSLLDRFKSALTSSYNQPIMLEGGVPLVEAGFLKLLRRTKQPIVLLAADETLYNLVKPLPYYTKSEILAHRAALTQIDGVIAVSDYIAEIARSKLSVPTVVSEPFVLDDKAARLQDCDFSDNRQVLFVGENRPSMNLDMAITISLLTDTDLSIAGKDTDAYPEGLGYVTDDELISLYEQASLFVFPAEAGAFPVVTLEALMSGTPILVSNAVGTSRLAAELDERLVVEPELGPVAGAIRGYFDEPEQFRQDLYQRSRDIGARYTEQQGLESFQQAYETLMERL